MAWTWAAVKGRAGDTWHRLFGPGVGPRVLVTSIPKSGTHLVISALKQIPLLRVCPEIVLGKVSTAGKIRRIRRLGPGQIMVGHIVHEAPVARALEEKGVKLVLMIRDPRDVVVSLSKHIVREDFRHRCHEYFTRALKTDQERLMACIRGIDGKHASDGRAVPDAGELYRSYLAWVEQYPTHLVRFEDLVGSQGGGSDEVQSAALEKLLGFLGLGMVREQVEAVARATFSTKALTFRKGEIGDWKNHFTPEHLAAFREVAGTLLTELHYE